MADVGIVIVNWNTKDYLRRCLLTLFASTGISYHVVVVDNGSTDGSAEMVAEDFPDVTLLSSHGNVGYPAGNNLGLVELGYFNIGSHNTTPRYALLLNPDTEVPPDALRKVVEFMDSDPQIGMAGPKLILPDGSLDLACRRSLPTIDVAFWRLTGLSRMFPRSRVFGQYNLTYLDENETAEVGSVVGAFMIVRSDTLEKVGPMDETFFMYGEDLDWAKRVAEAGWRVMYYPEVEVLHVKRAASRQSKRAKFEFVRAFLIFYNKHYRAETSWLAHMAVLLGIALWGGPRLWPEVFTRSSRQPAAAPSG